MEYKVEKKMEYIRDINNFEIREPSVISLGKFDGIHRGHNRLMEYLDEGKKQGLCSVIFTFDIPPAARVEKKNLPKVLTTNEEKRHLFETRGIDYLIECPFTPEVMHMEPEAFVCMLVERFGVRRLVAGTDFHFGHNRRGDYRLLEALSSSLGYEVKIVKKVQEYGRDISSTFIREEVASGNIKRANHLLGYPYFVQGTVVHGNQIGRTINVPTANVLPPQEKLLPPFGVYVTRTLVDGIAYGGITNVGRKPTVGTENPVGVETNLFDFERDIYGKEIRVEFLAPVRKERKFASLEDLTEQLQKDIAYGREYYKSVTEIC